MICYLNNPEVKVRVKQKVTVALYKLKLAREFVLIACTGTLRTGLEYYVTLSFCSN